MDFANYIAAPTHLSNFGEALSYARREHLETINTTATKISKEKRNASRRLDVEKEFSISHVGQSFLDGFPDDDIFTFAQGSVLFSRELMEEAETEKDSGEKKSNKRKQCEPTLQGGPTYKPRSEPKCKKQKCQCSVKDGDFCLQAEAHWKLNFYYQPKKECSGKRASSSNSTGPVIFLKEDKATQLESGPHSFRCYATNQIGTSGPSVQSNQIAPVSSPDKPEGLQVSHLQPEGKGVTLTFSEPVNNGGNEVTEYECTCFNSSTVHIQTRRVSGSTPRPLQFDNLINGHEYSLKCRAKNIKGWSTYSGNVRFTPLPVAEVPSHMTAMVIGVRQVNLSLVFDEALIDKTVKCWSVADVQKEQAFTIVRGIYSKSVILDDLPEEKQNITCDITNSVNLEFQVAGARSSVEVVVLRAPLPPTIVSVTPDDSTVTVDLEYPASDDSNMHIKPSIFNCQTNTPPFVNESSILKLDSSASLILSGIESGRTLQVICRSWSKILGWGTWSTPSRNVSTGTSIETTLETDGFILDIEALRLQLAEEYGVDPSQIVIEEVGDSQGRRRRLNSKKKFKIKVLVQEDGSAEEKAKASEIVKRMNNVDICGKISGSRSCRMTKATRAEGAFTDAAVKTLEVQYHSKKKNYELMPSFNPHIQYYSVRVQEKDFAIKVTPNSTMSTWTSVTINDDTISSIRVPFSMNRSIDAPSGENYNSEWHKILKITVTAPDTVTKKNYYITVNFSTACSPKCGDDGLEDVQGDCDYFTGKCICKNGWRIGTSNTCNNWCPSPDNLDSPTPCGIHGRCDSSLTNISAKHSGGRCKCNIGYSGEDCSQRVNEETGKNGGSKEMEEEETAGSNGLEEDTDGSKELDAYGCPNGWSGDQCNEPECPWNMTTKELCHGNGLCDNIGDGHTQKHCTCKSGYGSPKGTHLIKIKNNEDRIANDCSIKLERSEDFLPLSSQVEVGLVWGLEGYERIYHEETETFLVQPVYNKAFGNNDKDITDAIKYIRKVCDKARNSSKLKTRPHQPCWVDKFILNENVPMNESLKNFFTVQPLRTKYETGNSVEDQWWNFWNDIGTVGADFNGRVKFIQVRMKIGIPKTLGAREKKPYFDEWVTFLEEEVNNDPPTNVGKAALVSEDFKKMDLELRIISSTLGSWMLSNLICLASVLLFTQNILISLYTMLAIVLIVATLLGVIFGGFGYPFGAIEAVGVTIFVGLSVDYILHAAHGYSESKKITRKDKVTDSLTRLGISIVGGGLTTAGSCIFLFFCHIFLFVQLGVMLFFNCLIALFFAQFFLSSALMVIGPLEDQGTILWCVTGGCFKCKCGNKNANAATLVTPITTKGETVEPPPAPPGPPMINTEQKLQLRKQPTWDI